MSETAIRVQNVTKLYKLYDKVNYSTSSPTSMAEESIHFFAALFRPSIDGSG